MGSKVGKFFASASPLIVGVLASVFGPVGSVVGAVLVGGAALFGGKLGLNARESKQRELKYNTSATQATLYLIYGTRLVGSNDVFVELTNNNKTLWIVHCLGEGEIEGIAVDAEEHPLIKIAGKDFKDYTSGEVEYFLHTGTNDQVVDPSISAAIPKFTDTMRNTAYIVFKLKFQKFKGIPARQAVIKGIKVFDFTNPLDPPAWSDNPVLILYDYLTNVRYGLGWDPAIIDLDTWTSAKNYCDNHVKPWKFNYVVDSQISSQSIIDTILYHFRGALNYYAGKLFLHYAEDFPAIFSISDEYIVRDESGVALVSVAQPSTHSLPETVLVQYISPKTEWSDDDFIIGNATYRGKVHQVDFPGFTDRALAAEMAAYLLERERLNKVYTVTLRLDTIVLDVNDIIQFSSTELLLPVDPTKKYRVKDSTIDMAGLTQITFVEERAELYDAVYQDNQEQYIIDIVSPYDPPPPVTDITFTEELYTYRGRTEIRLKVGFTPPADYGFFAYVNVYVKTDIAAEYYFLESARESFTMERVEEGVTYYFQLFSVSTEGATSATAAEASHYVLGISTLEPDSPLDIGVNIAVDATTLTSTGIYTPTDPTKCNIQAWDFRLNNDPTAVYGGSLLVAKNLHPIHAFGALATGTYRFFVDTVGTNDVYGVTPAYQDDTKPDPPSGFTYYTSDTISYSTGTHVGTEEVGGELKCIITSGVISGTYTTAPKKLESPHIAGEGFISTDIYSGEPATNRYILSSLNDWEMLNPGDEIEVSGYPPVTIVSKDSYGLWRTTPNKLFSPGFTNPYIQLTLEQYNTFNIGMRFYWVNDPDQYILTVNELFFDGTDYWMGTDRIMGYTGQSYISFRLANRLNVSVTSSYFLHETFTYSSTFEPGQIIALLDYGHYMSGVVPNSYAGGLSIRLFHSDSAIGPWIESADLQYLTSDFIITAEGIWYYLEYSLTDYSPTPIPDPATRKQIIVKPSTLKIYKRDQ